MEKPCQQRWCSILGPPQSFFEIPTTKGRLDPMKTGLVVSAHPGDFVWRAGGAIALHAKKGYRVKIVCLSYGERGESQFAWKEPGASLASVKAGRKDEGERG